MESPLEGEAQILAPPPPAPALPPLHEREIDLVLGGSVIVKSYEGTSQYSQGKGGLSSCGLASLNALRCVLGLEKDGYTGLELVRAMMSQDLPEVRCIFVTHIEWYSLMLVVTPAENCRNLLRVAFI